MNDKIDRQYPLPPDVCRMLDIIAPLIGKTKEDSVALAIKGLFYAVELKGNHWTQKATNEEIINEITNAFKQRPELTKIVQETLFSF